MSRKESIFFYRCAYRAGIGAGTTFNTFGSVDNVFAVAFGNAGGRASVSAGAAGNAIITDFVCHGSVLLLRIILILTHIQKKSRGFV